MPRSSFWLAVALAVLPAAASAQQAPLTFDPAPPPAPAVNPATAPLAPAVPQQPLTADAVQSTIGPASVGTFGVAPPTSGAPPADPPAAAAPPQAPFQLTDWESQYLAQTLQQWELESNKINTFNADFDRYEYDEVWGSATQAMIWASGVLSYHKPDKGSFKIDVIRRWTKTDPQNAAANAPGEFVEQKDEIGERWVCDGKALYKYEDRLKQLQVTPIPPEMRGQAITDGPLPFLFGAKAQDLMNRYWIRPKQHATLIWLEALPKRQSDAANYDSVEVMLDPKTMQPLHIQMHLPGGKQRHVYSFKTPTINGKIDTWFGSLFNAPRTPFGWDKVNMTEEQLPPGPQAANPAAVAPR